MEYLQLFGVQDIGIYCFTVDPWDLNPVQLGFTLGVGYRNTCSLLYKVHYDRVTNSTGITVVYLHISLKKGAVSHWQENINLIQELLCKALFQSETSEVYLVFDSFIPDNEETDFAFQGS